MIFKYRIRIPFQILMLMTTWKHQPEMSKELQHAHPECQLLESCQHHKPWQPKENSELLSLEQSHRRCSFQPEMHYDVLFKMYISKKLRQNLSYQSIKVMIICYLNSGEFQSKFSRSLIHNFIGDMRTFFWTYKIKYGINKVFFRYNLSIC